MAPARQREEGLVRRTARRALPGELRWRAPVRALAEILELSQHFWPLLWRAQAGRRGDRASV